MHFSSGINRPPYETADEYLQTTEGCSHNSCTFCNMYQDIPFRMLSLSQVEEYLLEVKQIYGRYSERIRRVYLVGADPFALSADRLLERINLIRKTSLPRPTPKTWTGRYRAIIISPSIWNVRSPS